MHIARLLRGIGKTALTWAAAWVPVSLIPFGLVTLISGPLSLPPGVFAYFLISQAVTGAINGGVFAGMLAVVGRRKTFETLSLGWIAACGAVGVRCSHLSPAPSLLQPSTFRFQRPLWCGRSLRTRCSAPALQR